MSLADKATRKRPGLNEALARVERGDADGLAVAKLDRLSRSVRDLVDLSRAEPAAKGRRTGWALILLDVDVDTSHPRAASSW